MEISSTMTHLRFLKRSLLASLCFSDMERKVVPNLKPKREWRGCPLMLAEAAPVKEVRTTYGQLGSSPGWRRISVIKVYRELITLDFPLPAPPSTKTRGGMGFDGNILKFAENVDEEELLWKCRPTENVEEEVGTELVVGME